MTSSTASGSESTRSSSEATGFAVGLLGHGTVGRAFAELLGARADRIARLTGRRPMVSGVLTRRGGDFEEILAGSELIVELIGGIDPAYEYVSRALRAGRHVITANKQLLSQHGEELWGLAREHGVRLGFEAAVAGVVPVIRVLGESLAGAEIVRIHGIVNGTTNFILTEMTRSGMSYEAAVGEAQRLGYAEADPSDDVGGRDAAAKMAILARMAFGTPVHIDQVRYEGIEEITVHDIAYARELGLELKLIGTAERLAAGVSVRVHPAFLYDGHPLASVSGPFNAVTVESDDFTEITMSGPGAGGPQTASAVLGDVISAIATGGAQPAVTQSFGPDAGDRVGRRVGLLPAHGGRRPAGCAGGDRGAARRAGGVDQVGCAERTGGAGAAGDGHAPAARVAAAGGARGDRQARLRPLAAAGDQGHRRGVRMNRIGVIERYRDRLPFDGDDPVVTLCEGSTPLVLAERLSELVGAEVHLKLEGMNPTGSFKDRGMTCAVSAAVREGAKMVICASTGNTAASAAAYAAKAGIRCVVIIPDGKIATGKLAQALMHGARVIALRGNFDEALALVRDLCDRHPIALVNSVNNFRLAGQKTAAFELLEDLDGELDALCIPVGNAGNITAYWEGFVEAGAAPRLFGFQAEGAAPLVYGKPVAEPETIASAIRIGKPARWEEAMGAMSASRGAIRAVTDTEILAAYRLLAASEGVFCEPASAASVAGLIRYGPDGARRVACVLTGHGLKDPGTALEQAGAVIPCEPELTAIERVVIE